ncbi:MAG: hypothetical protein Q7S96_05020 [bacterium]|nr:hypothetical protein [bacterium]
MIQTTTSQQIIEENEERLLACMPEDALLDAVNNYLLREQARYTEERAMPITAAQRYVRKQLEPEIVARFGDVGRAAIRYIVQAVGMVERGLQPTIVEVIAESSLARKEILQSWLGVLHAIATETPNTISGTIGLDALLFPEGDDTEPLSGPVLGAAHDAYPHAHTWRAVLLTATQHCTLDHEAVLRVWQLFAHNCTVMIAEHEQRNPQSGGFLLHRTTTHEYALRYHAERSRCALHWRVYRP